MADNFDEGLFISLKVSLQTLKNSLDESWSIITASIKQIEATYSNIGENANFDSLNQEIFEQKELFDELEKSVDDVNEKLGETPTEPLKETNEKVKDTKKSTDKLAEKFQQFFGVDANAILGKFGLSLDKVLKIFTSPGGLITAFALLSKKVFDLGAQGVKVFTDFEQAMANTQSVAKASPADFKLLEKAALNAGETTRFKAEQAANALYDLASAGLSAKESAAALDGVLQLAGATQSDLSYVSATVTSTLSQFGLKAEESGRIANVFAAAIAQSQAQMPKLADSMRYAGTIAGQLGIPLEEVVANLEALYNKGFKGEQAGTALRNILGDLANTSSVVSTKLVEYGVKLDDIDIKTNGLTGVIQNLGKANLTTGQLFDVFGKETAGTVAALIQVENQSKNGISVLRQMQESITNTNAAQEAYTTQSNTLKGSFEKLNSVTEVFITKLFSALAPTLKKVVDLGTGVIKFLSATTDNTSDLTDAQETLKANTEALKTAINNYAAANKALNDQTKTLNETERRTLETRRDIAALQISTNLSKTIKSLDEVDKQYKKQSESTENYRSNINKLKDTIKTLESEQAALEARQEKGEKWIVIGGNVASLSERLKDVNAAIANNNKYLIQNEDSLNNVNLAMANANKQRQEEIQFLVEAVNIGTLQLSQIASRSEAIAKEVQIKAAQMKDEKLAIELSEKLAAGLIKESDLNSLNNKVLKDKIIQMANEIKLKSQINDETKKSVTLTEDEKKAAEERDRINRENQKALIDNRIELLNIQRNEEIAAAKKVGADVALINQKYDKQIAEERKRIEDEYAFKSLPDKVAQLKAEKELAIKEANEIGANTLLVEKYYDNEILKAQEEINEKIKAENQKKIDALSKINTDYYQTELEQLQARGNAEIAAIGAAGGDTFAAVQYWNNQIILYKMGKSEQEKALAKKTADDLAAIEKKKAEDALSAFEKILGGAVQIVGRFDEEAAGTIEKVGGVAVNVGKIIASGGTDITAWIGAIVGGIDLAIDGLESLSRWWDVNINKISKMQEYARYVFDDIQESFQEDIGAAFANAFEEGIDVDELKKVIGRKILKVAVDAAIFSAGIQDKLEEIGNKVSEAIENGFDQSTLDSINQDIEEIYSTTEQILQPLADNINESFDLIEEEVLKPRMGTFADYVSNIWEEASEGFAGSLSDTFINAFTEGFDLDELKKRIGEQLLQVAVESALFTIGFQDKMEELGALVADAINAGFTQQSLDAINAKVEQIYGQAASVIEPLSAIIGQTFGTGAGENFGNTEIVNNTTNEQQTGLVINQNISIESVDGSLVDVRRETEQAARDAVFASGIVA